MKYLTDPPLSLSRPCIRAEKMKRSIILTSLGAMHKIIRGRATNGGRHPYGFAVQHFSYDSDKKYPIRLNGARLMNSLEILT